MKISIPGLPGVKKGMLYLLLWGLCSQTVQISAASDMQQSVTLVFALGMGASLGWAIYEKISKNHLRLIHNKLEAEINFYKSDENIKVYLVNAADLAGRWDEFLTEAKDWTTIDTQQNVETVIASICQQIKKYNLSPEEFFNRARQGIADLTSKINELHVQGQAWKEKAKFMALTNQIAEATRGALKKLKEYNLLLEKNRHHIQLIFCLEKGIEQEYAQEIEYAYAKASNGEQILDQIIRAKSGEVLFPYLFYAQDLKQKLDQLAKCLNDLSDTKVFSFQEQLIEKAKYMHDALKIILQFVAASDTLRQEKDAKVEHDRNEKYIKTDIAKRKEHLRLETKERESKIAQQNALSEAHLLERKNRERDILNEKLRLEKEKKEIELRNQEHAIQLARIHEGHGIQKAVAENNSKWRADYDKLQSSYSHFKAVNQGISSSDTQHGTELKRLKVQLSTLESNIKTAHSTNEKVERYARSLETKLHKASSALSALMNKVNVPPVNSNYIEGLANYIGSLQMQIHNLQTILSS